ncbi:MAG: hypothetical protein IIT65_12270, partial [Lachnospiraceae bacterium]|nr:hypothetical protein [Lachnospiraceae bacterium]
MIDEQKVYEEFEEALLIALETYVPGKVLSHEALTIFIEDRVWESTLKYNRMINITRQKFFENLYKETTLDEYT